MPHDTTANTFTAEQIYKQIASELNAKGYAIIENAIPLDIANALHERMTHLPTGNFRPAGVGRNNQHTTEITVRNDTTCWIEGNDDSEASWLGWMHELKTILNSRLFLGLFDYECHFAHYGPNNFYKKHRDAFHGESNRVLSTVTYLNKEWEARDGGELILYDDNEHHIETVLPLYRTLVVFLSEEFPHEVLPANRGRFSIAGWFRVNNN